MSYAQPKMASLTGLSEEPIIHIVTNSGLKSRGLYNLGLVNRYFSTLELPLIYRDVEFLWMGDRLSRSFFQFQKPSRSSPNELCSCDQLAYRVRGTMTLRGVYFSDTTLSLTCWCAHMVEDCTIMPINNTSWDKAKYGKYDVLDSVPDIFEEAGVKLSITF